KTADIYTLSLHDALPILANPSVGNFRTVWPALDCTGLTAALPNDAAIVKPLVFFAQLRHHCLGLGKAFQRAGAELIGQSQKQHRSEEHTSELQSRSDLVC